MEEARLLEDLEGEQHDATFDAEAAVVLARHQLERYAPELQSLPLHRATDTMRRWHVEWAEDFQAYLRRTRDAEAVIFTEWPFSDEEYRRTVGEPAEPDPPDDTPPFEPTGPAQT